MNKIIVFVFIIITINLFSQEYLTHTVADKENLYRISKIYSVAVDEIMKLNNIIDPAKIKKGDILKIKLKTDNKQNSSDDKVYAIHVVKKNDTLWQISRKYGVNIKDILNINNLTNENSIKENMQLKIPQYSKEIIEQKDNIIHVLKEKETLYKLSKIYNVSVDEIIKLNKITDVKNLKAGTKLLIPDKGLIKSEDLGFDLPVIGEVKFFETINFSGIYIYTGSDDESRKVYTIETGIVSYVDNVPGYGLTVFIRHNDEYISTYSGFSEVYVSEGSKVNSRQLIGKAGTIARSDKYGIIFSIQFKGASLKFDYNSKKFLKSAIKQ